MNHDTRRHGAKGQTMEKTQPIQHEALKKFVNAVYLSAGANEENAALLADTLVQADLWGHQSHGVLRMSWYYKRIRNGVMLPNVKPSLISDAGAVACMDGNAGMGQAIAKHAMEDAIARAKKHGVAVVTVRQSNHFGTVMYYTRMAAAANCIAFMTSNGGPAMPPWGGLKKIIGTNPWSIASPGGKYPPVVLDIANTGVARGKIAVAMQRGEPIPEGWALTIDGKPTTDAAEAFKGIILPMAQHKGSGIGIMVDVLSGVLSGSGFLTGVNSPFFYDKKSNCGHCITVMNVEAFMPIAEYRQRIETFIEEIKSVPKAHGVEEVFYPGEIEIHRDGINRKQGITLPYEVLKDMAEVGKEAGVSDLQPFSV